MSNLFVTWLFSAVGLMLLAIWAGRFAQFHSLDGKRPLFGILIDSRERYSLNRFQLTMWTILILGTFLGIILASFWNPKIELSTAFAIPPELLGLIGISVASAAVSGAVKNNKNITKPETIAGTGLLDFGLGLSSFSESDSYKPRFAQVFLEEQGEQGNKIVNITKFQNFIFTIALGLTYIVLVCKSQVGYPEFDDNILWLIGISHAGYVTAKVPDKK